MKRTLIILSCFTFFITHAQQKPGMGTLLRPVNTIAAAEKFIKDHPLLNGELVSLYENKDTGDFDKELLQQPAGFIFFRGDHAYKLITRDTARSFRVSYIYIDGRQFGKPEADSIRKEIIKKYKAGIPFAELISQYNMDPSSGDVGWFKEKMMVPEFESAVRSHKKGDIYRRHPFPKLVPRGLEDL